MPVTWFWPGHSIETFPAQFEAVVAAGHEIGVHGYSHENPIAMTRAQETEILLERGFLYDHSLMHDDHTPHYVRVGDSWTRIDYEAASAREWMKPLVRGQETDLIEIPASWYLDDLPPMMFIKSSPNSHGFVSPRDIEVLWRDQFDWVYREMDYAVFPLTIHPDVSGRPQNLLTLERLLDHIGAHPGVGFAFMADVARDYATHHPATPVRADAPGAQDARMVNGRRRHRGTGSSRARRVRAARRRTRTVRPVSTRSSPATTGATTHGCSSHAQTTAMPTVP